MAAEHKISIAVIGTLDTKLAEFLHLRDRLLRQDSSIDVMLIDVGRTASTHNAIAISQADVRLVSGCEDDLQSLPRGEVIKTMSAGAAKVVTKLETQGKIQAIISLGGSGGTSIAAAAMRELPLTFPKLIVSTVASGDISSYVQESDITLMYSVVDIAGLNEVLRAVIDNAAAAIVAMARAYSQRFSSESISSRKEKRGIGITMFGVTTPAVEVARRWLEKHGDFGVYVFHATGAGGRAMERLVQEGRIQAVLDLTTTELADELLGGVMSAGENRLTAAAKAGIPQIVSVGALDMVNFGPKDTVPPKFRERNLFEHNPSVTLMRTTAVECQELGRRLARRLKDNCTRPELTEIWLPLRGVSAIAVEGQAFYDKSADEALFSTVKGELADTEIKVVERDADINNAAWAENLAERLKELSDSAL